MQTGYTVESTTQRVTTNTQKEATQMSNTKPRNVPATQPVRTPAQIEAEAAIREAILEMQRPEQSAEEMALSIMGATDLDTILGSTVLHVADMVGKSFTILSASLSESTFYDADKPENGGLPAFAVMETELSDGTKAIMTTGATNCVAQLIAMQRGHHYPVWVKVQDDTTRGGFTVYKFAKGDGERPTAEQLRAF